MTFSAALIVLWAPIILSRLSSVVVTAQPDAFTYNPTARDIENCSLSNDDNVTVAIKEEMKSVIERELVDVGATENPTAQPNAFTYNPTAENIGTCTPASSCADLPHAFPSGYYWIQGKQDCPITQVYCDMNRTCSCNGTGGWMRVANLDMTDPSQQCPSGFKLVTSPRRSCGRYDPGCVSTTFPVHGVEYSRVCGRVIGYQDGTPDAFYPYFYNRKLTIDNGYIDGVVLTHGSSPRNHIWTFAGAVDEAGNGNYRQCPCTRSDLDSYTGAVPPFVGEDYFCETGSRDAYQFIFYPDDPLWDGQGCGEVSTCCNHPLYFCKQLPQPTTDDIELRLCSDQASTNEDTPLERVEIYVQ